MGEYKRLSSHRIGVYLKIHDDIKIYGWENQKSSLWLLELNLLRHHIVRYYMCTSPTFQWFAILILNKLISFQQILLEIHILTTSSTGRLVSIIARLLPHCILLNTDVVLITGLMVSWSIHVCICTRDILFSIDYNTNIPRKLPRSGINPYWMISYIFLYHLLYEIYGLFVCLSLHEVRAFYSVIQLQCGTFSELCVCGTNHMSWRFSMIVTTIQEELLACMYSWVGYIPIWLCILRWLFYLAINCIRQVWWFCLVISYRHHMLWVCMPTSCCIHYVWWFWLPISCRY